MTAAGQLVPDDVCALAGSLLDTMSPVVAEVSWDRRAEPTRWSARSVLDHIGDALTYYAGLVARRAAGPLPPLRSGKPSASPDELLEDVRTGAAVLSGLLAADPGLRAWHPSGLADVSGWVGMACTEIGVHGVDVSAALGLAWTPPAELADRICARVFPWVGLDGLDGLDGTQVLLGVTGRREVHAVTSDPDWWWQSAPLSEWDGQPRYRTAAPRWT